MKIFPVTKHMLSGLCVFLIAFCLLSTVTPVCAADTDTEDETTGTVQVTENEPGSITVYYVLPEASFSIYRVADVDGTLKGDFEDCGVTDLGNTKAPGNLANYVSQNSSNITATATGKTAKEAETEGDYTGKYSLTFTGVPVGIYLVTGDLKWSGGTSYTPNSALLMIARTSLSDDTSLKAQYDLAPAKDGVTVPKYTMVTPLPDNTVDPVGENPPDDDINLGGDSVDQINEGNEGDTVNTVNSSPLGDDEVTTVKSSQNRLGASLPQTGQLWWPVFVLAGTGLGSITIGVRRRKDSK